MTIYHIASDRLSTGELRCEHCWDAAATHIELSNTGSYDSDEHLIVCENCAYLAGLKSCDCQDPVTISLGSIQMTLIPVFAPGLSCCGS